jgi:hypothetical protein
MKKRYHKIGTAYDAWWFLYEHPKLNRLERSEVSEKEAKKMEAAGYLIVRDERGGKAWRMWRHLAVPAVVENLDIHYAKTDGKRINDDHKLNVHDECWLEFGPVEYGYLSNYPDPKTNWDMETVKQNCHDWRLDCGGKTFDEALIRLARNVRKFYGDYKPKTRKDKCGKPVCGDCAGFKKSKLAKQLGLK